MKLTAKLFMSMERRNTVQQVLQDSLDYVMADAIMQHARCDQEWQKSNKLVFLLLRLMRSHSLTTRDKMRLISIEEDIPLYIRSRIASAKRVKCDRYRAALISAVFGMDVNTVLRYIRAKHRSMLWLAKYQIIIQSIAILLGADVETRS